MNTTALVQRKRLQSTDLRGKKYKLFPLEDLQEKAIGVSSVNLSRNEITAIPSEQLMQIAHSSWRYYLQKFSICNNLLQEIPREICLLVNLKVLHLDHNNITHLPSDIKRLACLEILSVKGNKLTRLPEDWRGMVALKELDIRQNKVSRLPRSLALLDELSIVKYKENPIVYPPLKTFEKDTFANDVSWLQIRTYLHDPMAFIKHRYASQVKNVKNTIDASAGALTEFSTKVKALLGDKQGRKAFAKFLDKECSLENLVFWEEVEQLKVHGGYMDEEDFKNQSLLIFYKYIKVDVVEEGESETTPRIEVNLPFEIKHECSRFFESPSAHLSTVAEYNQILSKAQDNIFQLLALDSFNRFKNSPEAAEIKTIFPDL